MLKIEVNLDSAEVDAALTRLVHAMNDTTPLMMGLAQVMAEASERAFETETDPITGARWPSLTPDYKRQRTEAGHSGLMLQRTRNLHTSMHQEYGHLYARYGTNVTYAAIQCFGGITRAHWIRPRDKKALAWRKGGKSYVRRAVFHPGSEIPRRRFLGVGPHDKQDMKEIIADYARKALLGK
nr:phage virion morphogenesis protein [uncultured Desulfovibrio sp.]